MSTDSSNTDSTMPGNSSNTNTNPIKLSPLKHGAQISIKLFASNFFAWRRQINSLLADMKCIGYITGKIEPQSEMITTNGISTNNPSYEDWFANDQLIVSFLLASMNERVFIVISGKQPLVFQTIE
ncbi:unnamed protein product [Vicia faba]|uniref:Retrotransposon Copia-like N-terminal domain-containing protein n=1 Tax=Vicia faba TaxID=3906 RepID=A0AAV1AD68_VICFA|nr:unnamed protein product [Vicia faba]